MPFSHDTEHSLACAVDLVNSAAAPSSTEQLPDVAALTQFVERHSVSEIGRVDEQDLASVHRLRTAVRAVFDAADEAAGAVAVNAIVSETGVKPRLTAHDGYPWHIHYFSPGAGLAEHLATDCGMALAQVVSSGEWERLRRCAAPDCDQVLVDLSRNRSKRYCDARTCGNRLHVAAYRERRRAATP